MKVERFTEFKTGELVPIVIREKLQDFSFVPYQLPPANWTPDSALWPLIVEARDRVATLNGIGSVLPDPALLLRPMQRREAIRSNSIEGTYVTPKQLLLFDTAGVSDEPSGEQRKDWFEVRLYDIVVRDGCQRIAGGAALDQQLIRELHRRLLASSRGRDKEPGEFRSKQVFVDSGGRYIPPPADRLDELLTNLIHYMNGRHGDPLVRAFLVHYQFEAIHPFEDGNGRIGRLLLSLCVFKWLAHSHAWLYLSEYFDRNRTEYIDRLFSVAANGEWDEWVEFCLRGAIAVSDDAIHRCRKLIDLKKEYESRVGQKNARMAALVTRLLMNPFLEVAEVQRKLGVTYPTAKADLEKLVAAGVLEVLPNHRPKTFVARAIFDVAYGD
jgi:Fic family protein